MSILFPEQGGTEEALSVSVTCPFNISVALGKYVGVKVVSFTKIPPVVDVQIIPEVSDAVASRIV